MKAFKPLQNTDHVRMLIVAFLLVSMAACNRQGPMGPEGPQGPDGQDGAGGGGGGVTTYLTGNNEKFAWEAIDGWSGYEVVELKMAPYDQLLFPQDASTTMDAGGPVLVSLLIDKEWHALPYKEEFNNGKGTYDYYVNYEIAKGMLRIEAKFLDDVEVEIPNVEKVKVVVVPASKTIPITL
jgi:hypothetical protein